MTTSMAQFGAPILSGDNYGIWRVKMETLLLSQGLWDIVSDGYTTYPDGHQITDDEKNQLKEDKMRDAKALFLIQHGVAESIFSRIMTAKKSKEAWDLLEQAFQGSSKVHAVKLLNLRRQFQNIRMQESQRVREYYNQLVELMNQMKTLGEAELTEQKLVEKVLISLPESFDSIVTAVEESKDLTTLPVQQLMSSLEAHEERKLLRNQVNETAFKVSAGKNQSYSPRLSKEERWCEICKKTNHDTKYCWSTKVCNKCKKKGHVAKHCREEIDESQSGTAHPLQPSREEQPELGNFTEGSLAAEHLFLADHSTNKEKEDAWYLDSGCTHHMTGNQQIFTSFDTAFQTTVRMGNGALVSAKGKGDVMVNTVHGNKIIRDVLLVPELKQNLLSVGQLVCSGFSVHFEKQGCKVLDADRTVVVEVTMAENRNFILNWKQVSHQALQMSAENVSILWHKRFGHLNFKSLAQLQTKELVSGLPKIISPSSLCEGCVLGKQHRQSFPRQGAWRASAQLELIHTDVCGKMQTPSEGQNWYFLTFIDDFSRMTWVYFLKEKSQAFGMFQKFKVLVENQTEKKIKVLRSDRGGEFTSNQFAKFCEDAGIRRQLTTTYTPQQNGVAERKNRTLVEMARAMMKDKGVPMKFWAEAVSLAVYIQNRCPTVAIAAKTPIEAWAGTKPDVSHLRVFGTVCYVHIPKEKRQKLNDKSEKCIMIGFSDGTKGYRLYNLEQKKIIVSRDVIFDEEAVYNWEESKGSSAQQNTINLPMNSVTFGGFSPTVSTNSDDTSSSAGGAISADSADRTGASLADSAGNFSPANSYNSARISTGPEEETQPQGVAAESQPQQQGVEENQHQQPDNEQLIEEELFVPDSEDESSNSTPPPRGVKSLSDIYARAEECNLAAVEPTCFQEAEKHLHWREAMLQELKMIEKNNTWELVDKPLNINIIGVKWLYKTKLNADGSVQKYKARLVVKGYRQKYGVDYFDTYAPVARLETIRTIIALAAQHHWRLYQLDVKSAFLNGELEEEIYVDQPEGFCVQGGANKVYKLKKALYGLKQALRTWYSQLDHYFVCAQFERSKSEPTLYVKKSENQILIVAVYVDDLIYTSNSEEMMVQFKTAMMNTYEMSDLGEMKYFLGIEVKQSTEGIFISQKKYAQSVIEKHGMKGCKVVSTPLVPNEKFVKDDGSEKVDASKYRSLVGSLLYLTTTRPDVMFSASLLSRYMDKPTQQHHTAAKRVLRYVAGTSAYGIWYKPVKDFKLIGYTDSDWAGCQDDMKSTSGYVFSLGSGVFSWSTKKQSIVALSSTEAEYVAAARAAAQAIWLRRILGYVHTIFEEPIVVFSDSKAAIAISENPISHDRTKHIAIKYHYTREAVDKKEIQLIHCSTEEQKADMFTKVLTREKFEKNRKSIGVVEYSLRS